MGCQTFVIDLLITAQINGLVLEVGLVWFQYMLRLINWIDDPIELDELDDFEYSDTQDISAYPSYLEPPLGVDNAENKEANIRSRPTGDYVDRWSGTRG